MLVSFIIFSSSLYPNRKPSVILAYSELTYLSDLLIDSSFNCFAVESAYVTPNSLESFDLKVLLSIMELSYCNLPLTCK